jgi:hypothetical protein
VAAIFVLVYAAKGLSAKTAYTSSQKRWLLVFVSSLHLQLLVGLLLYFVLSPFTAQALSNFGAAMKDPVLRYWAVEHAFVNIIAVALAQTGSILVKRTPDSKSKHKLTLIWTGIALLLILAMIPMGMIGVERPWFRF